MKNIHLVRHAQSMWNAWFATDNTQTNPLSPLWIEQAQTLADNRNSDVDLIIHSTYERTYQTAKPLIKKYPFAQILQNELIHEFTYLDAEVYKWTTILERAPQKELFWKVEDPAFKASDTAENLIDLFSRVEQTINYLKSLLWQEVVMFSHWQFMHTLLVVLQNPHILERHDIKKHLYQIFKDKTRKMHNTQTYTITDLLSK